jgi:hypothetical protein
MDKVGDVAPMRLVLQAVGRRGLPPARKPAETGLALARWAFEQGIEQVIAVVRPTNARALAMVRRIGMEWVGETEKYHNLRLQAFRLRPGDLDTSRPVP